MGNIPIIKHAVNNTLGTSYFYSLDKLIPAKIFIKGVNGEIFNFSNEELGIEFDVTMNENTPVGTSGLRELLVPVLLGTWNVTITLPDVGTTTKTVVVENIGVTYPVPYEIQADSTLAEFEEDGTYTIPEELEAVVILACGAGGGGGSGYAPGKYYSNSYGGSGGGGGSAIVKTIPLISGEKTLSVTIGIGGAGAPVPTSKDRENGSAGGATILTGCANLTIAGGNGGISNASSSSVASGGISGGSGGGNGGDGGYYSYSGEKVVYGTNGQDGLLGKGGTKYSCGGGGGGSIGDGGYGGEPGKNGTRGGGGGGSDPDYPTNYAGGDGGDGYVAIYKGVIVE